MFHVLRSSDTPESAMKLHNEETDGTFAYQDCKLVSG